VQIFWIFGVALRSELEWRCPSCQTVGTDYAAATRLFVSAHGSPIRWRDRAGLPVFLAAILVVGYAGTRGFTGAIWVVLAAILLAVTIGTKNNLHL
jgi:hypothetical protein